MKTQFLKHLDQVVAKAQKSGKITRLGAGQYFLYANNTLYYIAKYGDGASAFWGWSKDGRRPQDAFSTMAEAKDALFSFLA